MRRKILIQPNNIWVQIVTRNYLNNNNQSFIKVKKMITASNSWKHILDHKRFFGKAFHGYQVIEKILIFAMTMAR